MEVFIFIILYIIAIILLYHALRCIYVKEKYTSNRWGERSYEISESDKRLKHPLWRILLFIIILFIPILNIIVYLIFILSKVLNDHGYSQYSHYYLKSFLTKEY